jgi:hypothetical protein
VTRHFGSTIQPIIISMAVNSRRNSPTSRSERASLAITGVIDHRKQAPLVLDAWAMRPEDPGNVLVIAGMQQPCAKGLLAAHPCVRRDDVVVIDRYLSAEELTAVYSRAFAVFVLFDGSFSSGTLISAAQVGRWAITRTGGRQAKVANWHGFGIEADLTPDGVRSGIDTALSKESTPTPVAIGGRAAFGDRVLTGSLGC